MKINMCCPQERGLNRRRNTNKPQKYGEAGDVRRCHVVEELGGCRTERERRKMVGWGGGRTERERKRESVCVLHSSFFILITFRVGM